MRISLCSLFFVLSLSTAMAQTPSPLTPITPSSTMPGYPALKAFGPYIQDAAQRAAFYTALDAVLKGQDPSCRTPIIQPIGRAGIVDIENSMRTAKDEAGRIFALELALRSNYFTVRQVKELVGQIKGDDATKARLLKLVFGRLTNPNKVHVLADLLGTEEARKELIEAMETQRTQANEQNENTSSTP